MLRHAIAGLGLMVAGAVSADPVGDFAAWAKGLRISERGIVVLQDGETVAAENGEQGFDLASNSKAITALCLNALVQNRKLRWDMSLSEALGAPAPKATLAEVVTHSAGILPDSTQRRMGKWLNKPTPRHSDVTKVVLERKRQRGDRGTFAYSNENYALLGRIIERASGQDYEDTCRQLVLKPAGVTGALSPRFGAFAAWGGWRMTCVDFAKLQWHFYGPDSVIGRDPLAMPHAKMGENTYYGLGMIFRRADAGWKVFHAGALLFLLGPKSGAYAVIFADGRSAAVAYDRAVTSNRKLLELDQVLGGGLGSHEED
jgi:CubicO group peptidase (beta-lactamase class C family)